LQMKLGGSSFGFGARRSARRPGAGGLRHPPSPRDRARAASTRRRRPAPEALLPASRWSSIGFTNAP
jgi:hypothetical protein